MLSEDLSSVIKLYPLADKLLILFPFEWYNTIIRVFFEVPCLFREIVPALMWLALNVKVPCHVTFGYARKNKHPTSNMHIRKRVLIGTFPIKI